MARSRPQVTLALGEVEDGEGQDRTDHDVDRRDEQEQVASTGQQAKCARVPDAEHEDGREPATTAEIRRWRPAARARRRRSRLVSIGAQCRGVDRGVDGVQTKRAPKRPFPWGGEVRHRHSAGAYFAGKVPRVTTVIGPAPVVAA